MICLDTPHYKFFILTNFRNVLPIFFYCFLPDLSHNINVSFGKIGRDNGPFTNIPELAEFISNSFKDKSGVMVSKKYIKYLVQKLPMYFFVNEEPAKAEIELTQVETSASDNQSSLGYGSSEKASDSDSSKPTASDEEEKESGSGSSDGKVSFEEEKDADPNPANGGASDEEETDSESESVKGVTKDESENDSSSRHADEEEEEKDADPDPDPADATVNEGEEIHSQLDSKYDGFRAPRLTFGFLEFLNQEDWDEEDPPPGSSAYKDGFPEDEDIEFECHELVDSFFRNTRKFMSRKEEYAIRFISPKNAADEEDDEIEDIIPSDYNRSHEKDGLDELIKQVNKKVCDYVKEGKCGARYNKLKRAGETAANRTAEVATLLHTMSNLCSFQYAKKIHPDLYTPSDSDYALNFMALSKKTFKLFPQKKTVVTSLYERGTNPSDDMSWYGMVAPGARDLSEQYKHLFSQVIDTNTTFNSGNFEKHMGEANEKGWRIDSFDTMMTSLRGETSAKLDVRCPLVFRSLSQLARPYNVPAGVASLPTGHPILARPRHARLSSGATSTISENRTRQPIRDSSSTSALQGPLPGTNPIPNQESDDGGEPYEFELSQPI